MKPFYYSCLLMFLVLQVQSTFLTNNDSIIISADDLYNQISENEHYKVHLKAGQKLTVITQSPSYVGNYQGMDSKIVYSELAATGQSLVDQRFYYETEQYFEKTQELGTFLMTIQYAGKEKRFIMVIIS